MTSWARAMVIRGHGHPFGVPGTSAPLALLRIMVTGTRVMGVATPVARGVVGPGRGAGYHSRWEVSPRQGRSGVRRSACLELSARLDLDAGTAISQGMFRYLFNLHGEPIMSGVALVTVGIEDRIATITIDRQKKLNALNPEVLEELGSAFRSVETNDEVLGVILTGAGEKAFVAGADIGVLAEMDAAGALEISRQGQGIFDLIERFPKPVLAAVGGYALGGGCELALACHMRLASENARFGLPEVGLGLIPGYGGTVRLARLVGLGRAVQMTLTGEMVDAQTAERIGLVGDIVPRDELASRARELMAKVTKQGPVAVRLALQSVYHAMDVESGRALDHEAALFGLLAATDDMREGLTAFLEKRPPRFQGR